MRAWWVLCGLGLCLAVPALAEDRVVAVYPSAPDVPCNLLRITLRFAEPPPTRPRLALAGMTERAFVDEYLWSTDGRSLTLLFDPARLKTGVGANVQWGRVLKPGVTVVLTLDGVPIKRWAVGLAETRQPDWRRWTVIAPAAEGALVVRFDHPIDALSRDLIAVVAPDGEKVEGGATLLDGEREWRFEPATPWRPGTYRIAVSPELEDASGNSVAAPFETDLRAAASIGPTAGMMGFTIR